MVQPENMEEGAFMRELPIRILLGNSEDHEGIERAGAVLQAPAPE
jgi:hypothetical protein